jgi:hypothetical protein
MAPYLRGVIVTPILVYKKRAEKAYQDNPPAGTPRSHKIQEGDQPLFPIPANR